MDPPLGNEFYISLYILFNSRELAIEQFYTDLLFMETVLTYQKGRLWLKRNHISGTFVIFSWNETGSVGKDDTYKKINKLKKQILFLFIFFTFQ